MKLISKLTALIIIASFIFVSCEDEKEEAISASIHAEAVSYTHLTLPTKA